MLPAAVLLLAAALASPAAATDYDGCSCYETSAHDYFADYKFFDFRQVARVGGAPKLAATLPASASDATGRADDAVGALQRGFVQSQEWSSSWAIQDWGKGVAGDTAYRMWNSLSNVYFADNADGNANATSKLVLRTKRFKGFQSTAEVENLCVPRPPPPVPRPPLTAPPGKRTCCTRRRASARASRARPAPSPACSTTATSATRATLRS